jgi:hypothetical protein
VDETKAQSKALYSMIAFGFGECIGGLVFGWIIDTIGS